MILHHEKSKLKELDKAFARSKHNIVVKVPKVEPQFSSEKKTQQGYKHKRYLPTI